MSRRNAKTKSKAAKANRVSGNARRTSPHLFPKTTSALTPGPLAAVAAAPLAVGQPATATAAELGAPPPQAAVTVEGRFTSGDAARPPRSYAVEPIAVASAAEPFAHPGDDGDADQFFSALELDFFKRADDLYAQAAESGDRWEDLDPAHASPPERSRAH